MTVYDNPAEYLQDAGTDMVARINRLTTIIYNLENMLASSASGDLQSYSFNDGQSQINTTYRSLDEITRAINVFDTIRTRLINKTRGRVTILRDADSRYPFR